MLGQQLLLKSEEFLDEIVNENRDDELECAIESLRNFLEKEADGFTNTRPEKFCYAVQCRLEEVWDLVSANEKKINFDLAAYYDELMSVVEEHSGYEAERSSLNLEDEQDEYERYDENGKDAGK